MPTRISEDDARKLFTFEVDGRPRPKQRPRTYRGKGGQAVTTHTPRDTVLWENWVQHRCREAMEVYEKQVAEKILRYPPFPLDQPLCIGIEFYLPRPKKPKFDFPAVKPDIDNLIKSIKDGAGLAGLYVDDCRVVKTEATKLYSDNGFIGARVSVATM